MDPGKQVASLAPPANTRAILENLAAMIACLAKLQTQTKMIASFAVLGTMSPTLNVTRAKPGDILQGVAIRRVRNVLRDNIVALGSQVAEDAKQENTNPVPDIVAA